jgi:hypothetical protein
MKNSLDLWKDLTSLGLSGREAEVKYYLIGHNKEFVLFTKLSSLGRFTGDILGYGV